jgi:hypothetical protein
MATDGIGGSIVERVGEVGMGGDISIAAGPPGGGGGSCAVAWLKSAIRNHARVV